jgi:hypothetical protein
MFASPQLTDVPTAGGIARCRGGAARGQTTPGTANRGSEAIYYASRLSSQTGQGLFFAFLVVVAGPSEHGALGLGSVMIAMTVAAIALGPFGGAAVDRLGPRFALPVGAVLRLTAVVSALLVLGRGEYAWAAAFVYSAASQVFSPAELALVSAIRRRRPAGAHASLFALQFGGQVIGALALAPLLFWAGGPIAMLVGAVCCYATVVMLASVLGTRLRSVAANWPRTRRSALRFGPTLRFVGGHPRALYAVGLLAFIDVMSKCLLIAAPIYFQSELELGRSQMVVLAGTVALGAVIGLGWSARYLTASRSPFAMRVVLLGALVATFALTPLGDGLGTLTVTGLDVGGTAGPFGAGSLAALPAVFVLGVALSMAPIVARSVLTATTPSELQGRVFATEAVLSNILVVPALLLAALSTDLMSARVTVMLLGLTGGALFLALELRGLGAPRGPALEPVVATEAV